MTLDPDVTQSLSFLNPQARMRVLVHRKLRNNLESWLVKLENTHYINFCIMPDDMKNCGGWIGKPTDSKKPEDKLGVIFFDKDLTPYRNQWNVSGAIIRIRFMTLAAALGWEKLEGKAFVRATLSSMCKLPYNPNIPDEIATGMLCARTLFLSQEKRLADQVAIWILLYYFYAGDLFDIRDLLSEGKRASNILEELDPMVDRLKQLGMSGTEIRFEFINWLDIKSQECRLEHYVQCVAAVSGSKCFNKHNLEISFQFREWTFNSIFSHLRRTSDKDEWDAFRTLSTTDRFKKTTKKKIRRHLVHLLSAGNVDWVNAFVEKCALVCGLKNDTSEARKTYIESLLSDAFGSVWKNGHYHIAHVLMCVCTGLRSACPTPAQLKHKKSSKSSRFSQLPQTREEQLSAAKPTCRTRHHNPVKRGKNHAEKRGLLFFEIRSGYGHFELQSFESSTHIYAQTLLENKKDHSQ